MNETLENIALKLASKGHFDREIVEIIGVSESAFNEHKKRNLEFKKALKEAKESFDNEAVEGALIKRAVGCIVKETQYRYVDGKEIKTIVEKEVPPDSSALALYLRNRMPEKYGVEKSRVEVSQVDEIKSMSMQDVLRIIKDDPFFPKDLIS